METACTYVPWARDLFFSHQPVNISDTVLCMKPVHKNLNGGYSINGFHMKT